MPKKEYSNDELNSLIAEVEKEFTTHLAKAEESFKLAKSEDESHKDESKEKDEAKAKEDSDGESEKKMESEKPEDKGIKDQDQQKEGEHPLPAKDEMGPKSDEDHGYDEEDMHHMEKMYSSMSKGEMKAHHDCIRKCMDGMGLKKCEDGMAKGEMGDAAKDAEGYRPNGGPSDGEAAKAKCPKEYGEQAMEKSEKFVEEVGMLKSELAAAKAESESHQKNLEVAVSFLKKFLEKTAPAGKAITSLDIIAKTESDSAEKPLSKSEIDAKLTAKAKDFSLSKADRDAITSYYCGSKDIKRVSHLLK
jgi:hypothetical protein